MSSPLSAGIKLGRYQIRLLIGAGGMGEVYRARELMSVGVSSSNGSTFQHNEPTALFGTRVGGIDTPGDYYAVTANGQRFILNNLVAEGAYTPITVVLNWTADSKR